MLLDYTFKLINSVAAGPVQTLVSATVSTDNTIIYYDQWEDGFDVVPGTGNTTLVWGDGNAKNGCAPIKGLVCTDANDVLKAGAVMVISSSVSLPRGTKPAIVFDGGDRIQATSPIAVTRAAYPNSPGSVMAGAVEVLDTTVWGTTFVSPVGTTYNPFGTNTFQYSAVYVQAGQDNTVVVLPDGVTHVTLNTGQSQHIPVKQGDIITANFPVQVDLATGRLQSGYQLRWFSLLSTDQWTNSYFSPVGDTVGATRIVLYNAAATATTVTYNYFLKGVKQTGSVVLNPKSAGSTPVIPDGTGCSLSAPGNFIALSVTDTVGSGDVHDWGFPVMPTSMLTPQALIGLGYGCTGNNCQGYNPRSVVWVSPTQDASIFVDYENDGIVDYTFDATALTSQYLIDTKDNDMTGALIFATVKGSGPLGPPVNIAAAWGQQAALANNNEQLSLDLGTVMVPYAAIQSNKQVSLMVDKDGDGNISPGDTLNYTITIINVGQGDLPAGGYTVTDPTLSLMTYIPGTCKYATNTTTTSIPDNTAAGSTPFPLDGAGFKSQAVLVKRGGTQQISFQVTVGTYDQFKAAGTNQLVNVAIVKPVASAAQTSTATTTVTLAPPSAIAQGAPPLQTGGKCLTKPRCAILRASDSFVFLCHRRKTLISFRIYDSSERQFVL